MERSSRDLIVIVGGAVAVLALLISTIVFLTWIATGESDKAVSQATENGIQGGPNLAIATAPIPPATAANIADPKIISSSQPEGVGSGGLGSAGESPPAATAVTHIIQSGENLYDIALNYGVTVEEIATLNEIDPGQLIHPGNTLLIPVDPRPTEIDPTATGKADIPADIASPTFTRAPPPPTVTPTPSPTRPATPVPTIPAGITVNGLPLESILVMPDDVLQNVRQIYRIGQEMGRNPQAYSKVGDSTIQNPYFLTRFDEGPYILGDYAYLQPVIDYFQGSHGREGMAVKQGMHSWTVMDPLWADKDNCQPNETPLDCEIRLHNPSIMLLRLGSNDAGVPAGFDVNVRQVVEHLIANGVIPVIGTKADRFEGPGNINNEILRQIAADFKLPLWDFDIVAGTLPGRGLDVDNVHMTLFYEHDYTLPAAFQRGHSVHNLTALLVLDTIWREVILAPS